MAKAHLIEKIISGGQTGVDRGALEAAIELGIAHGGWCPRGRQAEDGPIDARFQLCETQSAEYYVRTLRNVIESDGTLIVHRGPLTGGTELTRRLAVESGRPRLLFDLLQPGDPQIIRSWLCKHSIRTLNVAGPRESTCPGIAEQTRKLLAELLTRATAH